MDDICTFFEAIAIFAYENEDIAARYGGAENHHDGGRNKRAADEMRPTASGLCGIDRSLSQSDPEGYLMALRAWEASDNAKWGKAVKRIHLALREGRLTAIAHDGAINKDFWIFNDWSKKPAQLSRFRRADLRAFLRSKKSIDPECDEDGGRPSPLNNLGPILPVEQGEKSNAQAGGLPPYLTPMQAVAWIVSRDVKVVSLAHVTQNREMFYAPLKNHLPPTPGVSTIWLELWLAWEIAAGKTGAVESVADAVSQLVEALRRGELSAYARRGHDSGIEKMPAIEWHDLTLDTDTRVQNTLTIHRIDPQNGTVWAQQNWLFPVFHATEVLNVWPLGYTQKAFSWPDRLNADLGILPNEPYLTATEVLTWIGLNRVKSLGQIHAEYHLFNTLWRTNPPDRVLLLLEAMSAENPFCPVSLFYQQDPGGPARYEDAFGSERGPDLYEAVLGDLSKHYKRAITGGEAALMLRAEIACRRDEAAALKTAERTLIAALKVGKITALGIPDNDPYPPHRQIPKETFLSDLSFNHDALDADPVSPMPIWTQMKDAKEKKRLWSKVQFDIEQVRRLWPENEADNPAVGNAERTASAEPVAAQQAQPIREDENESRPDETKNASIHRLISKAYDAAGDKPPNIRKIPHIVLAMLVAEGKTTTLTKIRTLAEEPQHKSRRRRIGVRYPKPS